MNYAQSLKALADYVNFAGIKPGLERITVLLESLGSPHQKIPVIHVAGTNGKGSVTLMTTNALVACNYRVGTYVSPHLAKYNERFMLNGQMISNAVFAKLFSRVYQQARRVQGITEFEILTAMAFLYFVQEKVDIAVMEVGLGGRFDATNVCRSILALITPISYDHEAILGGTLSKIAQEKAGIMKPGVPVAIAAQDPAALKVVLQKAEELECPCVVVEHPIKFKLDLLGEHQRYNAALVVEGLRMLQARRIYIPRRLIYNGIKATYMPGRLEKIADNPVTILDVGHNPHSFRNLIKVINAEYPLHKKTIILGLLQRKNLEGVLRELKSIDKLIAVTIKNGEAYTAEEIVRAARKQKISAVAAKSTRAAYILAKKQDAVIVIAGSFYLIGEYYK